MKSIRSFVKRSGRLSNGQQNALTTLLSAYTVDKQFLNQAKPLYIEVGFGDGEVLNSIAKANPEINFLGLEVHDPGVGHLLLKLKQDSLTNVKVHHGDALEFLGKQIKPNSVAKIMLFFPDPWHKKRHHKRRIIRPEFAKLIIKILEDKGIFHMTTDWQDYAEYAVEELNKYPEFGNLSPTNNFITRPVYRPVTKFEIRAKRLGHKVWDMMWVNNVRSLH